MSEVPLGAFLSGGIDSTVVTESMLRARERTGALKTFSVGYAEEPGAPRYGDDDELIWARRAAQALSAEHREIRISMHDAAEHLPRIVWHLDEPVADPACVPLYFLSRLAKEEVTVVLSGEGADELLGGYYIYQRMLRAQRVRQAGGSLLELGARAAGTLPMARLQRLARILGEPLEQSYRGVSRAFDDPAKERLLCGVDSAAAATHRLLSPHFARTRGESALRRMLHLDARVWLPDDLLIKADKMTMAHAIELRVPFLDHKLVEWAYGLPDHLKVRGRVGKWLLRRAAVGRVPQFILERPKKGFGTPAPAWLRSGLYELLRASLFASRSFARDRFDLRYVTTLVERHRAGADFADELWPLLVLELWHSGLAQPVRQPLRRQPLEVVNAAS
jgi:asparagine synthase (glutamine-hydrolysing)